MKKFLVLFAVLTLSIALSFNPAFAEKPVKMLGIMVLSGVVGAVPETGWGFLDACDWINDNGGINGKKFECILEDGRYDVPLSQSIYNRYAASEPKDELIFVSGYQTGVLKALAEKNNKEEKMVWIDGSMATEIFDQDAAKKYPFYFSTGPNYADQIGSIFKYIKEKHHKGSAAPKVAFLYLDAPAGRDPLEGMKIYAKKYGIEIVLEEPISITATDFTPNMLKVKNAKPDYMLFWQWSIPIGTKFVKAAREYLPKVDIFGLHYYSSNIFFELAGKDIDGLIATSVAPLADEDNNPFIKIVKAQMAKKGRKLQEIKGWHVYVQSWSFALLAAEGARRADKAGKLNRDGVKEALENIKDWDMYGFYNGKKFNYNTHKLPVLRFLKADYGAKKFQQLTDWIVTDDYLK